MAQWTKRERFEAVLSGEPADRALVSAWRHFPEQENNPETFARAMIEFEQAFDWDFLKLQPRGIYQHENWGNVYDYNHYNDVIPTLIKHAIEDEAGLDQVKRISGTAGTFGEQLTSLKLIKSQINPEIPVVQTIFTPIGVLLNLCGFRSVGRYRESPRDESDLIKLFYKNPQGVHQALKAIAETLAEYAQATVQAGADGVYYAALGMAREGYMTLPEWEEFTKPYDLMVLEALKPIPVILHTCGISANPQRFADFPIHGLHWAESAPGNPLIHDSWSWLGKKAGSGGVDERLFGTGAAQQIAKLAQASVLSQKGHPFILSPECSVSIKTQTDELQALRNSVEQV